METGRFPDSKNIEELRQKLFEGVDLITADDRRWPKGLHGIPERMGKLSSDDSLEKFDAMFFNVNAKQANLMDPQLRKLLEVAYECIVDAGYNTAEVRGSKTGVFIGISESDTNDFLLQDIDNVTGNLQNLTIPLSKIHSKCRYKAQLLAQILQHKRGIRAGWQQSNEHSNI